MSFFHYLKYRSTAIAAFTVCAAVVFLCLFLSDVPVSILWYPLALCVLIGAAFLAAGYMKHRRVCRELEEISMLEAELIDSLPEPCSPEAEEYQKIVRSLVDENRERQAEMTQKYNDMLDYYAAWAHQIKTPIAAMKLSFQNEDSALARQSLYELRRVEQYVDMVMTYLKLDSGAVDYVIRETSLDSIIRQAVRDFAGEFISRKIGLEYKTIEREVLTDEKWLTFVLEQIISNALKYTEEGTIRIYMDGDMLCISDTGIGIDEADIPRIFEKGFTGYNGRRDRRATGIGLYLCRRICDNLGHRITAESAAGKGTTICIDLKQDPLGLE